MDTERIETRNLEQCRSNQVSLLKMADGKIKHAMNKLSNIGSGGKDQTI